MNKTLRFIGIMSIALLSYKIPAQQTSSHFAADIFYNAQLSNEFSNFSTHVLNMQTIQEWNSLVQEVTKSFQNRPTDAQLYRAFKQAYKQKQPTLYPYFLYQSLKRQQALLGKQTQNLNIENKKIDGYVEIGSPCRHADYIHQYIPLSGMRYAIHDHTKIADVLESKTPVVSGRLAPYDVMIPLNDYDPISAHDIADQSVDMVVCFIGLHHIPTEKIEPFIASIKRILRPGGIFLLRDHDAYNQEIFNLAYTAHMVFNAIVAQSSELEEAQEFRNFQPLNFWIDLLEKHGLHASKNRVLQDGDPTLNTLIACTKLTTAQDLFFQKLHAQPSYTRSAHQTFLTTPEWFNVDCSQAYGDFLEHTPWYDFPYMESIKTYWYVFMQSLQQARTKNSWYEICIQHDYFATCLFIGAFMTVEYAAKAIVAAPVAYISGSSYETTITIVTKNLSDTAIKNLPTKVTIKDTYDSLHVLQVPRYKDFQTTLNVIAQDTGNIIEIGGQSMIQVKVRSADSYQDKNLDSVRLWAKSHGAQLDFTWKVPTTSYTYGSLIIPVNQLKQCIHDASSYHFEIVYIHDF